jgi:hypothetical protein
VLYYLRSARPVEISLLAEDLDLVKRTVREFLNVQNEMRFRLREGDHCRRCAFYKGLCPAGKN